MLNNWYNMFSIACIWRVCVVMQTSHAGKASRQFLDIKHHYLGTHRGILTGLTFLSFPAVAYAEKACAPDLSTIGELAGSAPDLSTLVAAVQAANLTDVLSLAGPIDVFAPTNDAFGTLLATLDVTAEQLLAETALLTNVLQYHVVVDGAVCDGNLSGVVQTAQGGALTTDGMTVTDANGGVANILASINAGNGVVYVIDSVLLPPPAVASMASAPAPEM